MKLGLQGMQRRQLKYSSFHSDWDFLDCSAKIT